MIEIPEGLVLESHTESVDIILRGEQCITKLSVLSLSIPSRKILYDGIFGDTHYYFDPSKQVILVIDGYRRRYIIQDGVIPLDLNKSKKMPNDVQKARWLATYHHNAKSFMDTKFIYDFDYIRVNYILGKSKWYRNTGRMLKHVIEKDLYKYDSVHALNIKKQIIGQVLIIDDVNVCIEEIESKNLMIFPLSDVTLVTHHLANAIASWDFKYDVQKAIEIYGKYRI